MAPATRLSARPERRINYATGSRADPIVLESSPEPDPDPQIEPLRARAAGPKTAVNISTQALRRTSTHRAKSGAPARSKTARAKEATHRVTKNTAKPQKQRQPAKMECAICAGTENTAIFFKLFAETHICHHWKTICKLCISNMVKDKVSTRQLGQVELNCPFPGCALALSLPMIKLNLTKAAYVEYDKALAKHFLSNDASYMNCLSSDCGKYFCIEDCDTKGKGKGKKNSDHMVECPYCNYQICLTCIRPWESHGSKSCAKVKEQEEKASAEAFKVLGVKPCPKCRVKIQKTGGCDHMFCRHCNHNFCWVCLVPYSADVQHAEYCQHGRIYAALDPRNWAHPDLNIEQVNQLIAQTMAHLEEPNAQRIPLAQVHPAPGQQFLLPGAHGPQAPPVDMDNQARQLHAPGPWNRPAPMPPQPTPDTNGRNPFANLPTRPVLTHRPPPPLPPTLRMPLPRPQPHIPTDTQEHQHFDLNLPRAQQAQRPRDEPAIPTDRFPFPQAARSLNRETVTAPPLPRRARLTARDLELWADMSREGGVSAAGR
ncbi:hypothetical protein J1614_005081 [Plenodomus biglobosus]|nr:hypothetical protein J1614_005081 [Plenodomus biglobosus]